jgi:hypothetical protein
MGMLLLGGLLVVAPVLIWPAVDVGYRWAMRRALLAPAAPTPELGDESPAVVNMLVHQGRVTIDAAEATLLDLASRGILELWAADGSAARTVVHVRQPDPPALTRYEAVVLDRVRQRAIDGSVPLSALAFKDDKEARTFLREFGQYVVGGATVRGLVEPTRGRYLVLVLAAVVVPALWLVAVLRWFPVLLLYLGPIGVAASVMYHRIRDRSGDQRRRWRLSAAGRERAAHWLGVRQWLRGFPSFADLPPAAVAVWDRYIAYGAALDATPGTSETIELGFDRKPRLWSSYGGQWRSIKVRTATWPAARIAMLHPVFLVNELVVLLVVGCGPFATIFGLAHRLVVSCLAVLLPLAYMAVRRLVDAVRPARVTGMVLQVRYVARWLRPMGQDPRALVIDEGRGDRLSEWLLYDRTVVLPGDVVQATAGRWHRRLKRFVIMSHAPTVPVATRIPAVAPGPTVPAVPALRPPATYPEPAHGGTWIAGVLRDDELSRMLGVPVQATAAGSSVTFVSTADGQPILRLEVRDRTADPQNWSTHPAGWAMRGIGDEAYCGPGWAVARSGPDVIRADGWPPSFPQAPAEVLQTVLSRWHERPQPVVRTEL